MEMLAWGCLHRYVCPEIFARRRLHEEACTPMLARLKANLGHLVGHLGGYWRPRSRGPSWGLGDCFRILGVIMSSVSHTSGTNASNIASYIFV